MKWYDLINPKKWLIFARYLKIKALKKKYKEFTVPEYKEQIVYRMNKCPECVIKGECLSCQCKSPYLFYDKDNWCDLNRWEEMLPPEEWRKFKSTSGITINPENMKELDKFGEVKWLKKNTRKK